MSDPKQTQRVPQSTDTKLYSVRGPGSVIYGGVICIAGTELNLTEKEAAGLGDAIVLGKLKPVDEISKRVAGKYAVANERSVWHDGKQRGPGFVLDLSEKEARLLGDTVEAI